MANNIQIIGNITDTDIVSRYSIDDIRLIGVQEIQNYFDPDTDYIEYFIYDVSGASLLGLDYAYSKFKLPTDSGLTPAFTPAPNSENQITNSDLGTLNSNTPDTGSSFTSIEIDPVKDLQDSGYRSGEFRTQYNFFKNKVGSPDDTFFLKRISADRTEISIASTSKSNEEIETIANSLIDEINSSPYFINYLVNFGLNTQVITVNIALDKIDAGYEILFKLYDPLPDNIIEKADLWVVEEKVSPYAFSINLDTLISPPPPLMLRGANFSIPISKEINTISTQYSGYNNLFSSLQLTQSNTYNKLSNALTSNSIAINVDYTDYDNFSFFGSVEQRLDGFYNKVKDIEDYSNLILNYSSSASFNPYLKLEINKYSASINNIISNFDGYETYLYFESTSYAWPKSTSTLPYTLFPTGSTSASVWFNNAISSASIYDELNANNLINGIPTYLRDDPDNNQYLLFLNMIGHYFDNIWILLKSVTDINLANNNPNKGISNDLVYQVLKSLGIDLFNSNEGESLEQYIVGNNTGSFIYSGSLTDFSATSSYLNNIPRKDLTYELYKRIYHNLPLLVKTKGTTAGLQNIITMFGVTSSILNVKEYGGESKTEYLKGYSTNKVRLSDTISTGSVLSPLTTIQQIPTSSVDYLDNDLQFVDISFSPQTQIDLYISQSISSSNPSWDMDEYIGDPRQQYYNTYPDLDIQRKIYFEQGTGSYSGFTSSYLDYNGFIRLIQFFDNSLFKTLESFVPARTSLSTGITINSPVLERNKFAYANPTTSTTESIHEGEINSGSIGSEYGFLYDNLPDDKAAYYDGEISGSKVNLYDTYFIPSNENPYLTDIDVWNSQHDVTESISLEKFALSDYNVLFNNVSSSVTSSVRKIIENPGLPDIVLEQKTSSISSSAELQDSYLSLTSYKNSRHDGSKIISSRYNEFTNGDSGSFGLTSAIDKFQAFFLTFKEIRGAYPELVNKSTLWINSLVDKDGNQTTVNFSTGSAYYYNLINNFVKDSVVNLQITTLPAGSSQTDLDQSTTVYRPALLWPKVILTNESGSNTTLGYPQWVTASLAFYESNSTGSIINKRQLTRLEASWSFGANSRNVLTASSDLASIFYYSKNAGTIYSDLNYPWAQDITSQSFAGVGGYDTPIPTIPKVGQEIRFLQNEDYVYNIISFDMTPPVIFTPAFFYLYLYLDKSISTNLTATTINNGYLIREYQIDPSKLVINAPKLVGNAPGYMTPQYMSPELATNLNGVVETLKENGIL
jgi:hypothetical protein